MNAPNAGPPPLPPRPVEPLPYQSPPLLGGGISCPKCGMAAAQKVSFTWWGGLIGPKLLNHHKCHACKFGFNGSTGKSNTTAIVIYQVVGFALFVGIGIAFYLGVLR